MSNEKLVAFTKKNDLKEKWNYFKKGVQIVSEVHDFGNIKYAMYSWQNAPLESFSSLDSSIGSVLNHLTLHRTGQMHDSDSGFTHMAHVLTRLHMYMVQWYRTREHFPYFKLEENQQTNCRDEMRAILRTHGYDDIKVDNISTDQLTPELFISMRKVSTRDLVKRETLEKILENIVIRMLDKEDQPNKEDHSSLWNDVFDVDLAFATACGIYNQLMDEGNTPARIYIPTVQTQGYGFITREKQAIKTLRNEHIRDLKEDELAFDERDSKNFAEILLFWNCQSRAKEGDKILEINLDERAIKYIQSRSDITFFIHKHIPRAIPGYVILAESPCRIKVASLVSKYRDEKDPESRTFDM